MQVQHYSTEELLRFDPLIQNLIRKSPDIKPFIRDFASIDSLLKQTTEKKLSDDQRALLRHVLQEQYQNVNAHESVQSNIELLSSQKTFTVTTGHQLCLFTGPLYSIFKVISTIKLAQQLKAADPTINFVPVFWMASEDHDAAEINHAYFFGKKVEWDIPASGPVGRFDTSGIHILIDIVREYLGVNDQESKSIELLHRAYQEKSLADATRYLFNELFGSYGLVILDADHPELKRAFKQEMSNELLDEVSFRAISSTNNELTQLEHRLQINPRNINLFYLHQSGRKRIERKGDVWNVVDTDKQWTQTELLSELELNPENFSPNVALRPVYQEKILPNIAYIGGPGEIAYWMQLKKSFEAHGVLFPLLVLRDSALLLSDKIKSNMSKLGLSSVDVFGDKSTLEKRIVNAAEISLDIEIKAISEMMIGLESKAVAVDPTLSGAVQAETQKMLNGLSQIEKKIVRALKQKEEVKLGQLNKLLQDVFPDGVLQERHDNYFQYRFAFGEDLIQILMKEFNPLQNQLTVISNE